jgi:metallo-beta-lactamase family protein
LTLARAASLVGDLRSEACDEEALMTNPVLTFLGAAGTVTGSRFLVECGSSRALVDAGLYQGLAELRRRNWTRAEVPAAQLDSVVVSHAHLDHCGYLPRLVADGFRGPIHCTPDTAELVEIVLRDSAHLQEEDARQANAGAYTKHHPALPLYDLADVERTLPLLAPVEYGVAADLAPGLRTVLQPAGHILGSASVRVEVDGRRALFSGDLGRSQHPLLRPPAPPSGAEVVVVESTYGDRAHPPPNPGILAGAVRRTVARGGSVLIPAFAVDRTELVLLELHRLMEAGEIPQVPVYVDSPMALAALAVYRRAAQGGSEQLRPEAADLGTVLSELGVRGVSDAAGSMRLNRPEASCIVVSASGMATGGRVIHHLAHQLPDPRNCVVLTGYQAVGTRGRQLQDGARQVKVHGHYVPVRAEIVDDVHGEPTSSEALATRIRDELGWCAVVPRLGERVRLD